jgi:hypothetical protein
MKSSETPGPCQGFLKPQQIDFIKCRIDDKLEHHRKVPFMYLILNGLRNHALLVPFLLISAIIISGADSLQAQCDTCTSGMVMNGSTDPWSDECYRNATCGLQGNPCQANDVNLIGTFIADSNGDPVPTCMPGDITTVTLWGRFVNGTNSNRYAVRTTTEVLLGGTCQITLNGCSFQLLPPGDTALSLLGTINYICGESIQLRNTWIGWETMNGATCTTSFVGT